MEPTVSFAEEIDLVHKVILISHELGVDNDFWKELSCNKEFFQEIIRLYARSPSVKNNSYRIKIVLEMTIGEFFSRKRIDSLRIRGVSPARIQILSPHYRNVGELITVRPWELLCHMHFGKKSLDAVRKILASEGLALRGDR